MDIPNEPNAPRQDRLKSMFRMALFLAGCPIILIISGMVMPKHPGLGSLVELGVVSVLGTIVITLLFVRWEQLRLNDVGGAIDSTSCLRLLGGFILGLLLVGLQTGLTSLAGHIHWVRSPEIAFSQAGVALPAFLFLACREEIAFRGYPLFRLESFFGPYWALFLMAAVFAVEHLAGGYSWANAWFGSAVGALLFGMAALATRGLAIPIGLHAAWNFGQWVLGNSEFPGLCRPVFEPGFQDRVGQTEMISYVTVMTLATFAFWRWYKRRRLE